MPATIKVRWAMDSMGNVYAEPECEKYALRFKRHVHSNGGPNDRRVFIQQGMGTAELEEHLGRRWQELSSGYHVVTKEDPWVFAHHYGYDAHVIVENGDLFK